MPRRHLFHLLLLCALAGALSLLFLQEPGFGDDLTYWAFAFDLHEIGAKAWSTQSFHQLRWPVWGVCWLFQAFGAIGITAYAGEAVVYLMAGSALAFAFGRLATGSLRAAWACGLAYLFCPLLDNVCHRPMPDLSESVWGAATMLAWWGLVHSETRARSLLFAALTGLGVYLCESNRLTGVFIAPVLAVATLLYARRRFWWLCAAGAFCLLFYGIEAAIYHQLFGDWLHNLHANLKGKDTKGIGSLPFWKSPFRFLNTLWKEGRLSPVYLLFALLGAWTVLRNRQRNLAASLLLVWCGVLYLEYACFPQSLAPWKPVIRDAGRFLAGLSVPMSVLAVLGARWLLELPAVRQRRWGRWIAEHPVPIGAAVLVALALITSRPFFDLGFLPKMGAYVRSLPAGTKVFTHDMMRSLAIMSDPPSRHRLDWRYTSEILERSDKAEALAAEAQEFWYMRKTVWLNPRKRAEAKKQPNPKLRPVGSYFVETENQWALAKLLVKGDDPDLVFYRRRTASMPAPRPVTELAGLLPPMPAEWTPSGKHVYRFDWAVPESLRGQCLALETDGSASETQAATVTFKFDARRRSDREILLKPYFHQELSPDFFVVPIPANAQHCAIALRFTHTARRVSLTQYRLVAHTPLEP